MNNSESSGEIEKTPDYFIVDSIVPVLGTPLIESMQYTLDMRMALSSDQNFYYEHELNFTNNNEGIVRALGSAAERLAWVQYFAKPEITIRHSPLALENGHHYDINWRPDFPQEVLNGKRFAVGETQYAVDYDSVTGHVFKSHSKIVQEEELSAYMQEWLARIMSSKNTATPSRTHLLPFAHWMWRVHPVNNYSSRYTPKDRE